MGNEQQSNKAEDNRQPTGLSASSASAVAELTSSQPLKFVTTGFLPCLNFVL